MKRMLILNIALTLILAACSASPATLTPVPPVISTSTAEFTSVPSINTPLPPTLTPGITATPAFDIQKLEGIWVAQDTVYIRQSADGKYTVVDDSIKKFLGRPLDGTITVEGDTVKLSGENNCRKTDVGIYRIKFSEQGDSYALSLVEDPCEYRKGGDVPAANTYHKLEASVLPGTYTTEVTQATAEAAGGGDLLKHVGEWELQLNADNTFVLLQNGQSVAQGEYLSAGEQFTVEHADVCSSVYGPVVRAAINDKSVTFSPDPNWTAGYKCKDMLLILTGHPWTKK
jgi:hypothetical protein